MVVTLDEWNAVGVGFVSSTEVFDSTTPQGRLLMHLTSAFAEFERSIIVERTKAGIAAAEPRGVTTARLDDGGRCGGGHRLSSDPRNTRLSLRLRTIGRFGGGLGAMCVERCRGAGSPAFSLTRVTWTNRLIVRASLQPNVLPLEKPSDDAGCIVQHRPIVRRSRLAPACTFGKHPSTTYQTWTPYLLA
jgi:hypothetical protein